MAIYRGFVAQGVGGLLVVDTYKEYVSATLHDIRVALLPGYYQFTLNSV
jgi:hypothetical protein